MFCLKCGEAIPDGSVTCPKCGACTGPNEVPADGQAVVYASQKETEEDKVPIAENVYKKKLYIWCVFALVSFVFLGLNYFKISISLYYSGSSDVSYSGYALLGCLKGSAGLAGYMVILLILTNLAVFITGIMGTAGKGLKKGTLKVMLAIESVSYLISTILSYYNIRNVLSEFKSDISTTSIGLGCYFNIVLAIVATVYFFVINNQLKNK